MESYDAVLIMQKWHVIKDLENSVNASVVEWAMNCRCLMAKWPVWSMPSICTEGIGRFVKMYVTPVAKVIDAVNDDTFNVMVLFSGLDIDSLVTLSATDMHPTQTDEYIRSQNSLFTGLVKRHHVSVKRARLQKDAKCAGTKRAISMCSSVPKCHQCNNTSFHYRNGDRICVQCGDCVVDHGDDNSCVIDAERLQIKKAKRAPYNNVSYAMLHLQRVQAKESGFIPSSVLNAVNAEIVKHKKDKDTLCVNDIHSYLSNTGNQKFYINEWRILCIVRSCKPNVIPQEREDVLIDMFLQVSDNWNAIRKDRRKSMLTYNYLFHKFCELQRWNDTKELFKIPKKTTVHDEIWKDCVALLGWSSV